MSGLWYSYIVITAMFGFLYSQIVPYEEEYLLGKLGLEYEEYRREVPALFPKFKSYKQQNGTFVLANLRGETPILIPLPVFWLLFWLL